MDFGTGGSPRLAGLRSLSTTTTQGEGWANSPYPGVPENGNYATAGLSSHSVQSASPRAAGFLSDGPEVARRAAEWERQIESLDQKEMEIHQTQLRLIREQTTTFRGDLLALQQELVDLKALVLKHSSMHSDLNSKVDHRFGGTERSLQEMSDALTKHGQLHQDSERKLSQLSNTIGEHHRTLVHHASMKERMEYIERVVGDSADKHQRLIEDAHSKLDQLHGRLSSCETGHSELRKSGADKDVKHAAVVDRVAYLEKMLGDSAEKHLRDLEALKKSHEKHVSDSHSRTGSLEQAHASVQSRLSFLEQAFGDSAEKHAKELEDMKNSVGKLTGGLQAHATLGERVTFLEKSFGDSAEKHMNDLMAAHAKIDKMATHGEALSGLRSAHANLAQELSNYSQHHTSQNERLTYIEQVLGDSIEKHNKELETVKAAHNKLATESRTHAQNHGAIADKVDSHARAHATLEQRLGYLEQTLGESADKHAKELASLKQAHLQHAASTKEQFAKHATIDERLDYIERVIGDSADKHQQAFAAHQQKIEHLAGKLADAQKEAQRHGSDINASNQRHATIEDRIGYLEKLMGDSADKHKWELDQIKTSHAKLAGDGKAVQAKHASLEDRMNYIENWFKGFKAPMLPSSSMS